MINQETIAQLLTALESDEYPCPCWDEELDIRCSNKVTYHWEHEYGDFGEKLSSWPEFEGCEKHIDQLNSGDWEDYVGEVLAQKRERDSLRKIVGIKQDDK